MKLIYCRECRQMVSLLVKVTSTCRCKECAGKYLSDNVTAVVTSKSIVVGIDNMGFYHHALGNYDTMRERYPNGRVDLFFSGWVPNWPGEVIIVDTAKEVVKYKFKLEIPTTASTLPTGGMNGT
jgi:hypothetical protein